MAQNQTPKAFNPDSMDEIIAGLSPSEMDELIDSIRVQRSKLYNFRTNNPPMKDEICTDYIKRMLIVHKTQSLHFLKSVYEVC